MDSTVEASLEGSVCDLGSADGSAARASTDALAARSIEPASALAPAGVASDQPVAMTRAPVAARAIPDADELDRAAELWKALDPLADSPLLHWAWARAAASTFLTDGSRLRVFTARRASELGAAVLLERPGPLGRLELVSANELDEPLGAVATDGAAMQSVAEAIRDSGRPVFLKRVPSASAFLAAMRRAYRGRGVVVCRPQCGYPWIPLGETTPDPEARMNAGRRSDLRRARRIAETMGRVRAELLRPSPEELPSLLSEAFKVEAASWKGRSGSALLCDPVRQAFYRRYAEGACRQGILRVAVLRIGPSPAAMQLGVEWGRRFWLLKMGYDDAFARCSPGTLLMAEVLRDAQSRGLRSIELLGAPEPWTALWTREQRPCVSLRAFPLTTRGAAALARDVGVVGGRRMVAWALGALGASVGVERESS